MRTEAKDAVRTRVLAQLAEENCCDPSLRPPLLP
jgi:hypothetical protein